MLNEKIKMYEQLHRVKFPPFRSLDETEATQLERRVLSTFGLTWPMTPRLWAELERMFQPVDQINANDAGFVLDSVLRMVGVTPNNKIYLWWSSAPHEIDAMSLADATRVFNDMWWPSRDDIDLFDDTCSWIIRVDHSGFVSVLNSL